MQCGKLIQRGLNVRRLVGAPTLLLQHRHILTGNNHYLSSSTIVSATRGLCTPPTKAHTFNEPEINETITSNSSENENETKQIDDLMANSSNRATRYVYLRTLPLAKQEALSTYNMKELSAQIEESTRRICGRYLEMLTDNRSEVHLHTAALALGTHRVLMPILKDETRVLNMIRAAFGAPLKEEIGMTEEEKLSLNEDQKVRPDYWVVKTALWFSFDKMAAVKRMVENFVSDFGKSFDLSIEDKVVAGLPRHTLTVRKCFYNDVCRAEGLPQVTSVFCALDKNIFAPLNVTKHKIRFTLDKTLADDPHDKSGGNDEEKCCKFSFVKIKDDK